jgi:hypothetical protein
MVTSGLGRGHAPALLAIPLTQTNILSLISLLKSSPSILFDLVSYNLSYMESKTEERGHARLPDLELS